MANQAHPAHQENITSNIKYTQNVLEHMKQISRHLMNNLN